MNLQLEQIFEILDEIKVKKLTEQTSPTVSSKKQKTITLPKITISEDWGKQGTPDRNILEFIVERASRGSSGRDPLRKLSNLNNYLDFIVNNLNNNFSMSKVLSSIIIIETMMKMFNSFSISSAGFLNEAFMSVFYGKDAEQVQVKKASGIEDIIIKKTKQYISLKTLDQNRLDIEGSLRLLNNTLNDDAFGNKITYHIFVKESDNGKIKNIRMYEIPIHRSNIPIFYPDTIDSQKAYMGLIYLAQRPNMPKQNPPDEEPVQQQLPISNQQADMFKEATTKKAASNKTVKPNKMSTPTQMPLIPKETGPDPRTVDYSTLELAPIFLRTAKGQPGKTRDTSEFRVPESIWMKFVTTPKYGLFLDLSDEKYSKVLKRATDLLDFHIGALFENLEQFSLNITKFFVEEHTESGVKAYRNAQELEAKTSKLVQTDTDDTSSVQKIAK